jgi:class 3 adenylate cyclase
MGASRVAFATLLASHRLGALEPMSRSLTPVVAVIALAGPLVAVVNRTTWAAWLVFLPYACVGALIAIRRPRNWIGWLLIGIGWGFLGGFLNALADPATIGAGTAPPIPTLIAWISSWSWFAALAMFGVIMVIFPASRLPTGRWRSPALATIAAAWLGVLLMSLATTITINKPDGSGPVSLTSPVAGLVSQPPGSWLAALTPVGVALLLSTLVGGAVSMVVRIRRAQGLERQQLRWLVAALVAVTVTVVAGFVGSAIFGDALPEIANLPPIIAFLCVPLAIGVAVLRYRLYDFDTIVNRAVLYGSVTAVILGVFGLANIGLQRLLEPWTGGQSALVTGFVGLAVGAQYGSLRRIVRPQVDRFLPGRALLILLFTDIVGSTEHLVELGDERWRTLLGRYRAAVRQELSRYGGHEVDTAGDGFFATFDRPNPGVTCAQAIRSVVADVGLQLRTGVHLGECEMRGEKVSGIEVHAAARIMAAAGDGEILLSSAVREAVSGTEFPTTDRGRHQLKGVPGDWQLYALIPRTA